MLRWKKKHSDPLDIDATINTLTNNPIESCAIMSHVLDLQFANAMINGGHWIEEQTGASAKRAQDALIEAYQDFFIGAGQGEIVKAYVQLRQKLKAEMLEQTKTACGELSGGALE